ncbi:Uncharacterized protein SCF082_LOCUS14058 [Durusdinium trenchii]|uniref:Uncharacterized protein n=1 Tax=Durusdinium trenchii TaxID=1381693 RepID=A0ABP0JWK3_9DINO
MSNYGKDFEKYMQGQGKGSQGGDYQKYMSKYTGSYQKYMQGQKEGTQEKKEEDKAGEDKEKKGKAADAKGASSEGKATPSVLLEEDTETTPAFLFYAPLLLLSVAGMGSMYVECQRRAGRRQQPEGYLQLEAMSQLA